MKSLLTFIFFLPIVYVTNAQKDTEFPKGWVIYLQAQQGMVTRFTTSPDLFVGGLRLSPQATLVPGLLRVGASAGAVFNNKTMNGLFGANVAIKLATINVMNLGSLLNLQLQAEHLWGTNHQKLAGGLLHIEVGQLLVLGLSVHRDYAIGNWWFQSGLGVNLLHKKKTTIEDPMK